MVKKKGKSKRTTLKQKYKMEKRVKEHHRKLGKEARRKKAMGVSVVGKKKRDPGIPNSWPFKAELLEQLASARERMDARRLNKRTASDLAASAKERAEAFEQSSPAEPEEASAEDVALQTQRAYGRDLAKVLEMSDVILEILDARDPIGSRSSKVEAAATTPPKRLVLVLNKVDLVPRDVAAKWLDVLRSEGHAVVAFKATTQGSGGKVGESARQVRDAAVSTSGGSAAVGVDALIQLLKNYSRSEKDGVASKMSMVVGVVGFPNAGKSSVIRSLAGARGSMHAKKAAGVSATAGSTKSLREIRLDSKLTLVDCPGVVAPLKKKDDGDFGLASLMLRGALNASDVQDAPAAASQLVKRAAPQALMLKYSVPAFGDDPRTFLVHVARSRGKLKKGGVPDLDAAAREVIKDFAKGHLKFYVEPPAEGRLERGQGRSRDGDGDAKLIDATQAKHTAEFDPLLHDDTAVLRYADQPTTQAQAQLERVAFKHDPNDRPHASSLEEDDDDVDMDYNFSTDYTYDNNN